MLFSKKEMSSKHWKASCRWQIITEDSWNKLSAEQKKELTSWGKLTSNLLYPWEVCSSKLLMVMVKISVTVNCYTETEPHRQILKSYGTCNIKSSCFFLVRKDHCLGSVIVQVMFKWMALHLWWSIFSKKEILSIPFCHKLGYLCYEEFVGLLLWVFWIGCSLFFAVINFFHLWNPWHLCRVLILAVC